jgi:hypothetical protein
MFSFTHGIWSHLCQLARRDYFTQLEPQLLRHKPFLIRALVLFVVLFILKVGLMMTLEYHLFFTHKYSATPHYSLAGYIHFYLFIGSLLGSLVLLGSHPKGASLKTIRWYNVGLILVGLLFVFLSFRRLKSNYLYPFMKGVLNPADLWSYLQMDLFFERPFLALYLLGYPLVYWILYKTKREHWSFYFLGGVAEIGRAHV